MDSALGTVVVHERDTPAVKAVGKQAVAVGKQVVAVGKQIVAVGILAETEDR